MSQKTETLSKVVCTILREQGLDAQEFAEVIAQAMFMYMGSKGSEKATVVDKKETKQVEETKKKEHKEPAKSKGKILQRQGKTISCSECGRDVFKQVADVYDTMRVQELIDAYKPIGHSKKLNAGSTLSTFDGVTHTDCVLCGAELALPLVGEDEVNKGSGQAHQIGPKPAEGVQSLGADDLGIV